MLSFYSEWINEGLLCSCVSLLPRRGLEVQGCFNSSIVATPPYKLSLFFSWGVHIPRCSRISQQYSYSLKWYKVFVQLKKQNRIVLDAKVIHVLLLSFKFSWDFSLILPLKCRPGDLKTSSYQSSTCPDNTWSRICCCIFTLMTWNEEFFSLNFRWLDLASVKLIMLSLNASFT